MIVIVITMFQIQCQKCLCLSPEGMAGCLVVERGDRVQEAVHWDVRGGADGWECGGQGGVE